VRGADEELMNLHKPPMPGTVGAYGDKARLPPERDFEGPVGMQPGSGTVPSDRWRGEASTLVARGIHAAVKAELTMTVAMEV
jgi:hypothetical protein